MALRAAFALSNETVGERFRVSLGVLGLLSELAEEQPVLCLVDDAQWLDEASADALVFAARRLVAEPLVLLFAARDGTERAFVAPGLPELRLTPLSPPEARTLLAARAGAPLAPEVVDWVVDSANGNPLALVELPESLSDAAVVGPRASHRLRRCRRPQLNRPTSHVSSRLPAPTQASAARGGGRGHGRPRHDRESGGRARVGHHRASAGGGVRARAGRARAGRVSPSACALGGLSRGNVHCTRANASRARRSLDRRSRCRSTGMAPRGGDRRRRRRGRRRARAQRRPCRGAQRERRRSCCPGTGGRSEQ